jgi:glycosyltransferase involved in cell wall biosynthesis
MDVAVIISTYNQPQSLRKCLVGLLAQTERNFRTIVADDGSGPETAQLLRHPEFVPLRIQHIWQSDRGWRKQRILNLVLNQIDAEYCIFIDGDCIPRADFVDSHLQHSRPNCYLSGGKINIPADVHCGFTDDKIRINRVFDIDFLVARDPSLAYYCYRLQPSRWNHALNWLTYRYATLNGSNASAWRSDILKVNGFDESFGYGSDDREFGARLTNAGVKSRWLKFSLIQIHLDHPSLQNVAQIRGNRRRLYKLFFSRQSWIPNGIDNVLERHRTELMQQAG